jgi:hypothetical protein
MTPEHRAMLERDFTRLQLRLLEVNIHLRAIAAGGTPVRVDLVEHADTVFGTSYTEIVASNPVVPDDTSGEDDRGEDPEEGGYPPA